MWHRKTDIVGGSAVSNGRVFFCVFITRIDRNCCSKKNKNVSNQYSFSAISVLLSGSKNQNIASVSVKEREREIEKEKERQKGPRCGQLTYGNAVVCCVECLDYNVTTLCELLCKTKKTRPGKKNIQIKSRPKTRQRRQNWTQNRKTVPMLLDTFCGHFVHSHKRVRARKFWCKQVRT